MFSVVEINDPQRLEETRPLWQELLRQTQGASFFQTLDWLELYLDYYGRDQQLRLLLIYDDGTLIGLLPLVIVPERHKLVTLRVLCYPQHDWGAYFGPIGPQSAVTLLEGLKHIQETPHDWDCIDLRWINRDDRDHDRTADAMSRAGFAPRWSLMDYTSLVELKGNWDDFLSGHSRVWRRGNRRKERDLAEQGEVVFIRYRPRGAKFEDVDPRPDLYDAHEAVVDKSWQASAETAGPLRQPAFRAYLRRLHGAAVRNGMADLCLLFVGGAPVACAYGYSNEGYVFGTRAAYDPDFANYGVGSLLQFRAIQDSYQRGDRVFDLGPGYREIKTQWCNRLVGLYRCTHFRANWRAQALRVGRYAKRVLRGRKTASVEESRDDGTLAPAVL